MARRLSGSDADFAASAMLGSLDRRVADRRIPWLSAWMVIACIAFLTMRRARAEQAS